ncbi:DsbA family oxidoreductase [Pseudahrensia aquimaris]|uniref:DsbA family oxidoreductase n=1 Tax=Pseudahrensia aquimaris TaxID=744461 RepID=A0ABW3FLT6_9HYPH
MSDSPHITIDVVSDVMCPWCYIGKRRLEQALAMTDGVTTDVRWRPFQLDATLPKEGRDRKDYLETKFGGPEKAKEIYGRIEEAGRLEGLEFNFSDIAVSPNTLDAHRLIRWAANEGEEVQNKLVEALFRRFFMEGAHIGRDDVLVEIAEEAGMDGSIVAALLATDKDKAETDNEIRTAQSMGVTGVPCFIIDNKYAVMGAQEPEHIAQAIIQAAEMKKAGAPGRSAD